jgi:hypothetical protein
MNHLTEEELLMHHYRDAEAPAGAEQHVAGCEHCRAQLEAIGRVLASVEGAPVPERDEGYGAEVWRRLAPRLDDRGPSQAWRGFDWQAWLQPQRLAWAGAMTVLLVAAFLAGRYFQPQPVDVAIGNGAPAAQVRERILIVAVGDHLERSQMILAELANAPAGAGRVDISTEQQRAGDLVENNRLYRQTAVREGDAGTAALLEELERVLLEIARSPSEISSAELTRLQQRIEARGILFKVRVVGSQLRKQGRQPLPPASQSKS